MTLSRFPRDQLGGGRLGPVRRYENLMIVMLIGGLCHGAAWTFALWGGLHGVFLVANHGYRALTQRGWPELGVWESRIRVRAKSLGFLPRWYIRWRHLDAARARRRKWRRSCHPLGADVGFVGA